MARRKLCFVTGSRAEYGLLHWLMQDVAADPDLQLQLIVTGTHLAPAHGNTQQEIIGDGFAVDARVDIEIGDDSPSGISRSLSLAVAGIAEAVARLKPDILVILGDRYEILGAAQAAILAHIPIAHICGGECTSGSIDDTIRHAITKMAHLHFATIEEYRQRIMQMGEPAEHCLTVGAPGLDNLTRLELPSRDALQRELDADLGAQHFLVTYHPVTVAGYDQAPPLMALLAALDDFPDHRLLLTGTNADGGGAIIARLLAEYTGARPGRVFLHQSLGQRRYLAAIKHATAVIGNSSSGLVEAPALRVPTVNVGERQQGRHCAPSVINCATSQADIAAAITRACDPSFRQTLPQNNSCYGEPGAAAKIKAVLKDVPLDTLRNKQFIDRDAPS